MYDTTIGRFTTMDDFEADPSNPTHLNKYSYAGEDPVDNWDPSGHDFSLTQLAVASGIGALIGGIITVGVNYALNRPLTSNLGLGIGLGAIAGPLALLSPAFGLGLAGFGLVSSVGVLSQVWVNPQSTWGQKGVSVLLVAAAAFGARQAYGGFQENGWYNPNSFSDTRPPVGAPLTPSSTLADLLSGVPDDAMLHLSPQQPENFSGGTNPRTFWVRFGDVKHLTLPLFRNFIGTMAQGGTSSANTAVIKLVNPGSSASFSPYGTGNNFYGIQEYISNGPVVPDGTTVITQNP